MKGETWIEVVKQHRLSVHIRTAQQDVQDAQDRLQSLLQERALWLAPFFAGDELVLKKDGRKLYDFKRCVVQHVRGDVTQGYTLRVIPLKKDGTRNYKYTHVALIWPAYAKFWDRIAKEVTQSVLRAREKKATI